MSLAAVLMAAGSASRMGYRPKCLLHLNGTPLIERTIQALKAVGVQELIVVLGHYHESIRPFIDPQEVHCVINPHPDEGQISSQRLGLQALKKKHDAIVMALADQPLIEAQDIELLLTEFRVKAPSTEMLFPVLSSGPGNPVIISNTVREDILSKDSTYGCRQWRADHRHQVQGFLSDNTHFSCDLDTPEDIQALQQSSGLTLTWDPNPPRS
jgi:CTP:molybdopterin cytidylyltransferase MocA